MGTQQGHDLDFDQTSYLAINWILFYRKNLLLNVNMPRAIEAPQYFEEK